MWRHYKPGDNNYNKYNLINNRQERQINANNSEKKEQGQDVSDVALNQTDNHYRAVKIPEESNAIEKKYDRNESTWKYKKKKHFFGYRKLLALLELPPNEVLMSLIRDQEIFNDFLESANFNGDSIVLFFEVLNIVIKSPFTENRAFLLLCLAREKILENLKKYISSIPLQSPREKSFNLRFWNATEKFLDNVYNVLNAMLEAVTATALDVVPQISQNVTYIMKGLELKGHKVSDECKSKYESLQLKVMQAATKKAEKPTKKRNDHDEDEDVPPDNFREIDIYPSPREIGSKDNQVFLRKNKVEGAYKDPEHYLDVQFRLLREDFLRPLRDAITEHMAGTKGRISNVKIFRGARSLGNLVVQGESGYLMKVFDPSRIRNLQNCRRFMFGSMVCLTSDNFKKIIFGKIIDSQLKYLKKGILGIGLHGDTTISETDVFDFVEYGIYFEPYYQVLTALQNIQTQKFPMVDYLVYVEDKQTPPRYILQDLSFEKPDVDEMNLNDSQKKAFEAALNNEFCIIQGPPGTGKTFLGLKIATTLLKSNAYWKRLGPMLVVCFTNHALDQFLEGLLPTTKNLIRIGGQSRNDNLDAYNLRNFKRNFPRLHMERLTELKETAQKLHNILESYSELYHKINNYECIVNFQMFNRKYEDEDIEVPFCHLTAMNKKNAKKWLFGSKPRKDLNDIALILDGLFSNINTKQMIEELDDDMLNDLRSFVEIDHKLQSTETANKWIWFDPAVMNAELSVKLNKLRSVINRGHNFTAEFYEQVLFCEELRSDIEVITGNLQYLRNMKRNNLRVRRDDLMDCDEWSLNRNKRWLLYDYYTDLLKPAIREECQKLQKRYAQAYVRYCEMRDMMDVSVIQGVDVIGMTTTGAARMHKALQALKCPVVIVEEAAEVLEAHVVTALSDGCQHLILIGDHEQLKPTTSDYHLTNEYNLGVSLFERMVLNNYHCNTLNVQHRMRPEIANLVAPAIYPTLQNHDSVNEYPAVRGVVHSLFFIDHRNAELEQPDGSKENRFEAEYLLQLARYLVLNGYEASRITILVAYSAQFFLIRKLKHSECLADVKICVLDNYQGEENDIVLLSLVRNNAENKIGFLKLKNRVCVALSRAKQGFYLMGNMEMLCAASDLWGQIKDVLIKHNALGEALQLKCMSHPDNITEVRNLEDFRKVPEGGCLVMCGKDLPCGHKCPKLCHPSGHSSIQCQEDCQQILCDLGHVCPKRCHERCGRCMVPKTVNLKCGHEGSIPCHMHPDEYDCNVLASTLLDCGHTVDKPCHMEAQSFQCYRKCDIRVEPCGHSCSKRCHLRDDPEHIDFRCPKACTRNKKNCSSEPPHPCDSLCWMGCPECDVLVKRNRSCGHLITLNCSEDVEESECPRDCQRKLPCGHNCKNKCQDECGPCKRKVEKLMECGHTMKTLCFKTSSKSACNSKTCKNLLKCGHQCNLPCREPCSKAKCDVLVPYAGGKAPCGHDNTLVPCNKSQGQTITFSLDLSKRLLRNHHSFHHLTSPHLTAPPRSWLLDYCTEKCQTKLKCGHNCGGTCSECFQGRVHKSCVEPCQKILVCGHSCKNPCRATCRSCNEICQYRCPHSYCRKRCGAICTPCKENCVRKCPHQKCRAKCHAKCTVPPCSEPCPKKLRCGHPCIGFCGDPCPPLCRICNRQEVTEIFFGTEDEDDARFVYLPTCKHTFESSGLDTWCRRKVVKETQNEEIGVLECPKCKTPITAQRYSEQAKLIFKDLAEVKKKVFGNYRDTHKLQQTLRNRFAKLAKRSADVRDLNHWFAEGKKRADFDQVELDSIRCKVDIIEELLEIVDGGKVFTITEYFMNLLGKLNCQSATISEQTVEDFNREILRFRYLHGISSKWVFGLRGNADFKRCHEILTHPGPFTDEMQANVKEISEKLGELHNAEKERREIIGAMQLTPGHWYKCPNGHIYCITECGGAMQTSKCNECGSAIGGSNYRLLESNSRAIK